MYVDGKSSWPTRAFGLMKGPLDELEGKNMVGRASDGESVSKSMSDMSTEGCRPKSKSSRSLRGMFSVSVGITKP